MTKPISDQARLEVIRYLRGVMNDRKASDERRDRAASRLASIVGDGPPVVGDRVPTQAKAKGLKVQREDEAQSLLEAGSKFTPSAPPRLN